MSGFRYPLMTMVIALFATIVLTPVAKRYAIKKGAIVPGKVKESELVSRITAIDPKEMMPPAKSHKKLTQAQKDTLTRWIADGAEYQLHWSLLAPKRAELPKVKNKAVDRIALLLIAGEILQKVAEAPPSTSRI